MNASERFIIEQVNGDGQPIYPDKAAKTFINQCGVIVRDNLSINIQEWHKPKTEGTTYVDDRLKKSLWEKLMANFTLPEEVDPENKVIERNVKKWALKKMGDLFKNWKKNLNLDFVQKGLTPDWKLGKYSKIKNQWADFVKYKTSEEALKRSKINKENAAKKVYHHVMGRGGYKTLRPKWEKMEKDLVEKGIHPETLEWEDRIKNWFFGHGGKLDEAGQCVYNKTHKKNPLADIKNPLEGIKDAMKEVETGKFKPDRENDVLTKALGNKEHPGRTRGTEGSVPWKDGFPECLESYRSRERKKKQEKSRIELIEERLMRQEQKIESLQSQQNTGPSRRQLEDPLLVTAGPSPSQRKSSVASTEFRGDEAQITPRYPVDDITGKENCELHIKVCNLSLKVAVGYALPHDPNAPIHGNRIPPGYAIVAVDEVMKEYEKLELDYPTGDQEHELIAAKGTTIVWKKENIKFPDWRPPTPPHSSPPHQQTPPQSSPAHQRTPPQSSPARDPTPPSSSPARDPTPPPSSQAREPSPAPSQTREPSPAPSQARESSSVPSQSQKRKRQSYRGQAPAQKKTPKQPKLPKSLQMPPKRPYDLTEEENKAAVDAECKAWFLSLKLKRQGPPPPEEIPFHLKDHFRKWYDQLPGSHRRKQDDYERSLNKSLRDELEQNKEQKKAQSSSAPKIVKKIPQLGEQDKQSVAPLKVLPENPGAQGDYAPDVDISVINMAIQCGCTVEELQSGKFSPPPAEVAYLYEFGKDLVIPEKKKQLGTQMRRLHDWYLSSTKKGIGALSLSYKQQHWYESDRLQIEFDELFQLYNGDALDISLLSCYCL